MADNVKFLINTEIEVPVNLLPLMDSGDFETVEDAITFDAAGMALFWNFISVDGERTVTQVIPSDSGDYEWINELNGLYTIVIPASGGATINNDTAGYGWFTGKCDGVLGWRGPILTFITTRRSVTVVYAGDEPPDTPSEVVVEGLAGWEEVNALSLYRYAKIMNINPVHLATAGNVSLASGHYLFPLLPTAGEGYYLQRSYFQSDQPSREEIIEEIGYAESEIEDYLGFFVAPKWIYDERLSLPQHYDPLVGYNLRDVRGNRVKFHPKWGRFIAGGQRASEIITENVDVVYSDEDGDGFDETATIEFDLTYEGTDLYEIKCYFAGYEGSPQYEIRPPLSKSKDGATVQFVFETWKMINPALREEYPTDGDNHLIDIASAGNLVTKVDFYRKFNSTASSHATFYYETSENDYAATEQDGYIKLVDPDNNGINIIPGNYDDGWSRATICGNIRHVGINYLSGYRYRPLYGSNFWDELHPDLAKIIAYLATARLSRPLQGKPQTTALSHMLQENMAESKQGQFRRVSLDMLDSPFGTKAGEIMAYIRLEKFQNKFMKYRR